MWVLISLFCRGGFQKKSTFVSGWNFRRYIKTRPWLNESSFNYLNCKCCTNLQTRENIYICSLIRTHRAYRRAGRKGSEASGSLSKESKSHKEAHKIMQNRKKDAETAVVSPETRCTITVHLKQNRTNRLLWNCRYPNQYSKTELTFLWVGGFKRQRSRKRRWRMLCTSVYGRKWHYP